jgi:hypothetical protein
MKRATRAGGVIAAVCLLAAAACSSDGGDTTSGSAPTAAPATAVEDASDEPTTTEPPETTPSTDAPTTAPPATTEPEADKPPVTTTAVESTLPSSSDTVVVPFYVTETGIPLDLTCESALLGFNVSFSDDSGGSTVVEARIEHFSVADVAVNTTCTEDLADGEPALLYAAVLDAPAAETYESIALRYPIGNGQGSDRDITVFEIVTQAEAEAGPYVEVGGGVQVPLDPSEVEDFPLAD